MRHLRVSVSQTGELSTDVLILRAWIVGSVCFDHCRAETTHSRAGAHASWGGIEFGGPNGPRAG